MEMPSRAVELCGVLSRSLPTRPSGSSGALPPGSALAAAGGLSLVPQSLHSLCLRTAAIYATTSLYEFHDKQKTLENGVDGEAHGDGGAGGDGVGEGGHQLVHESAWEQVFPLLDQHFLRLVPGHCYERFLDTVLEALEVASRFDRTGKQLMQYIVLFFPRHIRRFRVAQRYDDRVLMPTVCCLHKCVHMEELYLERADSSGVTTYLLAHVLKFVNGLKVLSLPPQADDDVLSTAGINCRRLEAVVLTDTKYELIWFLFDILDTHLQKSPMHNLNFEHSNVTSVNDFFLFVRVTNSGLSWLLCCKRLHTVILPGVSHSGITVKGVALLLAGLPSLRHMVCDLVSEVLVYTDFNTCEAVRPRFALKSVLFHSVEMLSSNHLELVTKLCPAVEWLSLNSALFYNLEGLGHLPCLKLLRLNYKGRPLDQTVLDFFSLNFQGLRALHLFDVKELGLDDLHRTVGLCPNLETMVMCECSFRPDWWESSVQAAGAASPPPPPVNYFDRKAPLSRSLEHLQLVDSQVLPWQMSELLRLLPELTILDADALDLDFVQWQSLLREVGGHLRTIRCPRWTGVSRAELTALKKEFRECSILSDRQSLLAALSASGDGEDLRKTTLASRLLSEYADFSVTLGLDALVTSSSSP